MTYKPVVHKQIPDIQRRVLQSSYNFHIQKRYTHTTRTFPLRYTIARKVGYIILFSLSKCLEIGLSAHVSTIYYYQYYYY